MFIERLKKNFKVNTPIFTREILKTFPEFTRAYVFRLINAALKKSELCQIDTGTYYLPTPTIFGLSVVLPDAVIKRKYISDSINKYGIYSGLALQNAFSFTTQIPNTIEITTNNTSSRRREITIGKRRFILKKSRFEITKENANAYCILQLFSENNGIEINGYGKEKIIQFIKENKISQSELLEMAKKFPAKALKKFIYSGVSNVYA